MVDSSSLSSEEEQTSFQKPTASGAGGTTSASDDDDASVTPYPYHEPRISPDRFQARVPTSIQVSREVYNSEHAAPRQIWARDRVPASSVSSFLEKAFHRAPFIADEQSLLSALNENNYESDAAVKTIPRSRLSPSDSSHWGTLWMRKMIECGGNLQELEAGLKAIQTSSPMDIDRHLLRRCKQLRDRAMEFNVQMREASLSERPLLGLGRLRNIIQTYTSSNFVDTPALQRAVLALHTGKSAKRRLNQCTKLQELHIKNHDMTLDEATRLHESVQKDAPFVSFPQLQLLKQAIKTTRRVIENEEKRNDHRASLRTPLGVVKRSDIVSKTADKSMFQLFIQFEELLKRRGDNRVSLAKLLAFASQFDSSYCEQFNSTYANLATTRLTTIESLREHLREAIASKGKELSLKDCQFLLKELADKLCCVTDEEERLKLMVTNTTVVVEKIVDMHRFYFEGKFVASSAIELLCAQLCAPGIAHVSWSGDERTCPITWLRNIRQFSIWATDRVSNHAVTKQSAIELLARVRAARIYMPSLQAECHRIIMKSQAISPTVAIPLELDHNLIPIASNTPLPATEPTVSATNHPQQLQSQPFAQAGVRKMPNVEKTQSLVAAVEAHPEPFRQQTMITESQKDKIILHVENWILKSRTLLSHVQNDDQIRKHIAEGKALPFELSEHLSKLEDRLWENSWLQRVVKCHDLLTQTTLLAEAKPRVSSRIEHTVSVLQNHIKISRKWVESVRYILGRFFQDADRILMPLPDNNAGTTASCGLRTAVSYPAPECMCFRSRNVALKGDTVTIQPLVSCSRCSATFHSSCLGFAPVSKVEAPSAGSYICMRCSSTNKLRYSFADLYPPRVEDAALGNRGPRLDMLESLMLNLPPKLITPEKTSFVLFVRTAQVWASRVKSALKDRNATVQSLRDLYLDGEGVRVILDERGALAQAIHSRAILVSSVVCTPAATVADAEADAASSSSSSTVSFARNQSNPTSLALTSTSPHQYVTSSLK
uniref:Zinc finger PHD-type domain-containing protein n=1 Tax=Spongospora subterranea TaxID=70186 RepID=A0A0H5QGM6_9EUKA|eukprot:CRZ01178.1 hypothetical protein [Spongospora subterranea]